MKDAETEAVRIISSHLILYFPEFPKKRMDAEAKCIVARLAANDMEIRMIDHHGRGASIEARSQ